MISRGGAVLLLATLALLGMVPAASGGRPPVGPTIYLVRVDPRACPSPLCGGYWVTRVNHAATRCADGTFRARCYTARSEKEGQPLEPAIVPDGALVRADIAPWTFEGFGNLGSLVVADVYPPAGRALESGGFHRLVDTGIRCVRAPCFSIRATRVNRSARSLVSDVDLSAANLTGTERLRAETSLHTKGGLLARGRIGPAKDGGRVFHATRVFLRSRS